MTRATLDIARSMGVEYIMYSATFENSCNTCMDLDGNIYNINGSYPDIPLHPNCNCDYIPVSDGWKDNSSMDTTDYDQWIKDNDISMDSDE